LAEKVSNESDSRRRQRRCIKIPLFAINAEDGLLLANKTIFKIITVKAMLLHV
jgi:hypothetical protein